MHSWFSVLAYGSLQGFASAEDIDILLQSLQSDFSQLEVCIGGGESAYLHSEISHFPLDTVKTCNLAV